MGGARISGFALALVGCATGGMGDPPGDGSSSGVDANCNMLWYADADKDGHGDPMTKVPACAQPPDTVATGGDCDDKDRFRFPGAPEVCDSVDNDCNPATTETCPASCQAVKRPAPSTGTYIICDTTAPWASAKASCAAVMGFHLVQIDDEAENTWLRSAIDAAIGNDPVYIGANDTVSEGIWRWDGSDTQFWQGGSNGSVVGSRYATWDPGEPNDDNGDEECGVLRPDSRWNDIPCDLSRRYVCER